MNKNKGKGPKFSIDIEGTIYSWDKDTITTEEIIDLGGWDPSQGALLIKNGTEQNLSPGQIVEIKPGMGFSKNTIFKRGNYEG